MVVKHPLSDPSPKQLIWPAASHLPALRVFRTDPWSGLKGLHDPFRVKLGMIIYWVSHISIYIYMNQPLKSIMMDKNWFLDILRRVVLTCPSLGAYLNISNIVNNQPIGVDYVSLPNLLVKARPWPEAATSWASSYDAEANWQNPGWHHYVAKKNTKERKLSILPTERSSK